MNLNDKLANNYHQLYGSTTTTTTTTVANLNANPSSSSANNIGSNHHHHHNHHYNHHHTNTNGYINLNLPNCGGSGGGGGDDDVAACTTISLKDDIRSQISMRSLCPGDREELKALCAEWFPVDYPETWYNEITTNQRFYTLVAIYQDRIIGMIVAEIKLKKNTDREDWFILSRKHSPNTQITYILSLGVFKEFRRLGIASLLLDTLLAYLKAETDCKAVYLHVLYSNTNAIRFYEKRGFQQRVFLPNYYTIKGQLQDGYCYVFYMNGGEPPWTFTFVSTEFMKASWSFLKLNNPCKLVLNLTLIINNWLRNNNRNHITTKDFYRIS